MSAIVRLEVFVAMTARGSHHGSILAQQRVLGREVLDDGLHDQVGLRERRRVDRRRGHRDAPGEFRRPARGLGAAGGGASGDLSSRTRAAANAAAISGPIEPVPTTTARMASPLPGAAQLDHPGDELDHVLVPGRRVRRPSRTPRPSPPRCPFSARVLNAGRSIVT